MMKWCGLNRSWSGLNKKGNALPEYILPLALITLVSVPVWISVANGFGLQTARVFTPNPLPAGANNANFALNSGNVSTWQSGNINGVTGNSIINNMQPMGTTSNVAITETVGVNGEAQKIQQAVNELLKLTSPAGTSQQLPVQLIDIITSLANKGHLIAGNLAANNAQISSLHTELITVYSELLNFRSLNSKVIPPDVDKIILDNYNIIDGVSASVMAVGKVETTTVSSTTITVSSNTICNQGGTNCIK